MTDRQTFEAALQRDGFEAREVRHAPGRAVARHAHPFTARLLCLAGNITVATDEGGEINYGPGDVCEMPAGREHTEQVGAAGVHLLVGRRHD